MTHGKLTMPSPRELREADVGSVVALAAHAGADHAALLAVEKIHQPLSDKLGAYCGEDGQPWPCDTHRALDQVAVAKSWAWWRSLDASRAVPRCRECKEFARMLPNGNGAVLRHKPGCQSVHAIEGRACNWRDRASLWVRDLFD